jgi:FtsH-binding integral membrane protein
VRAALRADALFEVVLGLALVTGPATGLIDELDLPAADAVLIAFGAILLPFALVLWLWSAEDPPRPGPLMPLVAVNALTGAFLGGWILASTDEAPDGGVAFVLVVAAVLLALAAAQAALRPRA